MRLIAALAAFWLVLSGHYSVLLLVLGGLSVLGVGWLVHRIDTGDGDAVRASVPVRAPMYAFWLAGQVLVSCAAVLRQVWSPRLSPRPVVGHTPVTGLSAVGTAVYANSITLTPGTLSLQLDAAGVEVHALRQSGLRALRAGSMLEHLHRAGGR